MTMKSGIYKITNTVNGKFYIGSSEDVDFRWKIEHKRNLVRNEHCNPKLQHSWNFHGADKFVIEVIEEVEPKKELLLEREQYYLDVLRPYERTIGYNICPTAKGGDNFTHNPRKEEIRETLRQLSLGENNGMFGKIHAVNTIKVMKQKSVGRYTLDWFTQRYGKRCGKKKFVERNIMLKSRKINYSYDNKLTGTKRGPMSEACKKSISDSKIRMRTIRKNLHSDILSEKYTIPQLETKYGVSKPTILRERRKLMNGV